MMKMQKDMVHGFVICMTQKDIANRKKWAKM